ncbi:May conjugate Arg from its aminoacyl-tRNA to the N- termini of proteins containing an N-terminal aspartate or glutamate [Vibrio sp. B1REV9]|uniref:arginyltransferase n=1 Tax=Vibrio sp. B1REV9 TaxID=2751179 RepID=UPI001AFC9898|nr:arginyltransferase [Vibrio sp. B1REV9]CAE6900125.1 May conjugate Arg from its aminoacyl-tRNA to the N- termini of proteins containing an N-terminal aspartate or glutamate [Vibrio sp. B1REV9]
MSTELQQIRIGLTNNHPCSYLPNRQERVAVALDEELHTEHSYQVLLANGFRRSGNTIYKPHCELCSACDPIRVSIADFVASKSQKRLLNKATQLRWEAKPEMDKDWFDLYSRYICKRHKDGTMYPPQEEEFARFAQTTWLKTRFLHIYDGSQQLVAIAVTDEMSQCASAFYTFFDPDFPLSLGTLAVLYQIEFCQKNDKHWLYLGYQIDECPAMNYKTRFQRHQRLVNQRWQG